MLEDQKSYRIFFKKIQILVFPPFFAKIDSSIGQNCNNLAEYSYFQSLLYFSIHPYNLKAV